MFFYFIFSDLDLRERRKLFLLVGFHLSDYLSFSQISEKSHYVVKTNFFILSQLTIFPPIYLSYDMKHHCAKLKMFHYYPLQKKLKQRLLFILWWALCSSNRSQVSTLTIQSSSVRSRQMGCENHITCILPRHFQAWL